MEESKFLLELKFISALVVTEFMKLLCAETVSALSLCSSHPLFSCVVTFCTLVFLYLPRLFRKMVLSPVLILTAILLLAILRLGAIQRSQNKQKERSLGMSEPIISEENRGSKEQKETNSLEQVHQCITDTELGFDSSSCFEESFMEWNVKAPLEIVYEKNRGSKEEKEKNSIEPEETNSLEQIHRWTTIHREKESDSEGNFGSNSCFEESFSEWNVKAPLEVIYEEYEGEEENDEEEEAEEDPNERVNTQFMGIPDYPLLSRYDLESDSNSSSEGGFPPKGNWDLPENACSVWDEEDREGLIEIALEGCCENRGLEFQFEEENLIEIDISPARYRDFSD